MVVDAVRTYFDAANGLTELSRKQAVAAAKALLKASGPAAPAAVESESPPPRVGQSIQTLAGELIETSQSNRAALADLVRTEVERQLELMDVVPRGEHERLVRRIAELERRMAARPAAERTSAPAAPADRVAPVGTEPTGADEASAHAATDALPQEPATGSDEDPEPAPDTAKGTSPDTEDTEDTGALEAADADSPSAERSATSQGTADKPAAPAAPARAKTPAKNNRPRSTPKRTTKGKGSSKK